MTEYIIERVEEDDPMRCQATTSKGQCPNRAVREGKNCPVHGGNKTLEAEEKRNIRNYRVAKFQVEMNRHADSPKLKSLTEEIGILRMLLEAQLNQCQDLNDMVMKSHLVCGLVMSLEKLVKSCHTLDSSLGNLMDKQAILTFASKVIEVISAVVTDDDQLKTISDGILQLVGDLGNNTDDEDE